MATLKKPITKYLSKLQFMNCAKRESNEKKHPSSQVENCHFILCAIFMLSHFNQFGMQSVGNANKIVLLFKFF